MALRKQHKALNDLLMQYGMRLVEGKRHMRVETEQGKYLTSVGCSPSDPYFARQTVRYLVRDGILPEEARKLVLA